MKANDVMIRQVYKVKESDTVREVIKKFIEHSISGLPVVNEKDEIVAYVSDGDIMRYIGKHDDLVVDALYYSSVIKGDDLAFDERSQKLLDLNVLDIATKKVIKVSLEEDIENIAAILGKKQIKKLPVENNGVLVGIISRGDVIRHTLKYMAAKDAAKKSIKTEEKTSLLRQPRAVWAVFFACIIAFMGLGLVDPILPAIAKKLNATPSEVTLLFTSYNAVMALAMLITGAVSSRIGVKWTLLSGIVVIALFSALGGFSNDIWRLVELRGGWGLGNALFVATSLAAIVSLSNSGTAKAIILYEAAIGLGISVGPLLGGWLGAISWRGPFLGVAALMIFAFIGLVLLMPKEDKKKTVKTKISLMDPFRALKHRSLLVFGIAAALYNFGFFTLLAYSPFVMGLDEHGLGYVFLGWGLLLAITSVFMAPKLKEMFGTIRSMCAMLTMFALVLFIMGIWTSTHWVIITGVIFAGALLGNNNTLITTAVMNSAPVQRSTASAAYSFLRFIGGAIAPFLAGKLAEWYNPQVPFIVGGIFVMLSVIFIILNNKHVKHVEFAEAGH